MADTRPEEDLEARLRNARSQLEQFEQLLSEARSEFLRRNFGPEIATDMLQRQREFWNPPLVKAFFEPYRTGGIYPIERLPGVTYWVMDFQLANYFIRDSMIPIHSTIVFRRPGFALSNPRAHPDTYMDHLCITQAMIGQVRILWERLMGLVYYLEEGRDPPKSIRKAFFSRISQWGSRWDPLIEWKSEIDLYDRLYRTPEFHHNSRLRAGLLRGEVPDPNHVISLLTPVMNGFWQLLLANVQGVPSGIISLGRHADAHERMTGRQLEDGRSGGSVN